MLKRFGLKLGLILAAATVQIWTPWGFSNALSSLAAASAGIAVGLAMALGHRWRGPVLSYWDEAVAFAAVALLAGLWWHYPVNKNAVAKPSPIHALPGDDAQQGVPTLDAR